MVIGCHLAFKWLDEENKGIVTAPWIEQLFITVLIGTKVHANKFHLCDNMNGGEKIKQVLFRICFLECADLIKKKQK